MDKEQGGQLVSVATWIMKHSESASVYASDTPFGWSRKIFRDHKHHLSKYFDFVDGDHSNGVSDAYTNSDSDRFFTHVATRKDYYSRRLHLIILQPGALLS